MFRRVYLDEDSCGERLIAALRRRGVDVVTADEAGRRRDSDPAQLEYATQLGRPIVTGNYKDFARLHASWSREGRSHGGIIVRTQGRYSAEVLAGVIAALCDSRTQEQFQNALIWL